MTTSWRAARRTHLLLAAAIVVAALAGCVTGTSSSAGVGSPDSAASPATPTRSPGATAAASPAGPRDLILATTTSTQDSGLLDVLVPAFERASGYTVKTVAVGSGQALKMGEEGNADVLLVHSPAAEKAFIASGKGVDRVLVMHNSFLVVGPAADPAGVKGAASLVDAFTRIRSAAATFVSRGDGSGTETKELGYWKQAGISPAGAWYLQAGQGMAGTLRIASEKGGYTLTDIATWAAIRAQVSLEPLVTGDASLINPYHVIGVNPAAWPRVNAAGAKAFAAFLLSAGGQALIGEFGRDKYGTQLFVPDAGKTENDLAAP